MTLATLHTLEILGKVCSNSTRTNIKLKEIENSSLDPLVKLLLAILILIPRRHTAGKNKIAAAIPREAQREVKRIMYVKTIYVWSNNINLLVISMDKDVS